MARTLGGSLFVRNAIRYDYCVLEALESLYALCDEISVLECGSEDGTADLLKKWAQGKTKPVHLEVGHPWEVAPNYQRLAILANAARQKLKTDWHFMLQADEVLHEKSIPVIHKLIEKPVFDSYLCRRYNLMTANYYIHPRRRTAGDVILRLGKTSLPAVGDAQGLGEFKHYNDQYIDELVIFHYGIREGKALIEKTSSMQSWFFGPGGPVDRRIVRMKRTGEAFDPGEFFTPDELVRVPIPHPIYSRHVAEKLERLYGR